jgi:RNA ligase
MPSPLPDEITTVEQIQQLVMQGFTDWKRYGSVNIRLHEELMLFNYSSLAMVEARWNTFEQMCRGLIVHTKTGEVVARPFDKFFNYLEGGRRPSGHIVAVMEKMDGSLGILYRHNGNYHVATRGGFTSEQGLWATEYLRQHHDLTGLDDSLTLLFEIIYPQNRIVVNYKDRAELVLLAARNRHTGDYLPFFPDVYEMAQQYRFGLPNVYQFNNIGEIVAQTGIIGADNEGYVVEFSDGSRFKFKGDRYKELQKLLMGLTFKNTLRAVSMNTTNYILSAVPDEFLDEVKGWIAEIQSTVAAVKQEVTTAFDAAPKSSRHEFAAWVSTQRADLAPYLFILFDGKDITPLIYKRYPWGERDEKERFRDDA